MLILLRSVGSKGVIIYLTSSDDFALEAYGVHAARYLLKPVSEKDFFVRNDLCTRRKLLYSAICLISSSNDFRMKILLTVSPSVE